MSKLPPRDLGAGRRRRRVRLGPVLALALVFTTARAAARSSPTVTASASDCVRDVLVPDGMGGYFHVDFILLTPRGILVIDLRDVPRQHLRRRSDDRMDRHGRPAALHVHQPAGRALRPHRRGAGGGGDAPTEGRIVFTKQGKFPKGLPKWTLMVDALRTEFPLADTVLLAQRRAL